MARVSCVHRRLLLCASTAAAQNVTEPSLKAAFIYNFAKFTAWPADALPPTGSFTACVLGDTSVYRRAGAHRQGSAGLGAWRHRGAEPARGAAARLPRALRLGRRAGPQSPRFWRRCGACAVLTISDIDDFAQPGRHRADVRGKRQDAFRSQSRRRQTVPAAAQREASGSWCSRAQGSRRGGATVNASITRQLTVVNTLVSGVALLLGGIAFGAYDRVTFEETLVRHLSTEAQIAASNSVSALVFNDPARRRRRAVGAARRAEYRLGRNLDAGRPDLCPLST